MTRGSARFAGRFKGPAGRRRLLECITQQAISGGNEQVAQRLLSAGRLQYFRANAEIAAQGAAESDIFLIVLGSVDVVINGRVIAERSACTHIGEMALLDPTAVRSATIRANDDVAVLKIPEVEFTRLANRFPVLWRRIASELAKRLRERSRFIPTPREEPVIFIGSSSEALEDAKLVHGAISRKPVVSRLWTDGVFELSKTAIESLIRACSEADFAALFLTPDDVTVSRSKSQASPRDNAIFELGLFMGALGRERTIIVNRRAANLKIPTDLLGITRLEYSSGNSRTRAARLSPVIEGLWTTILELGTR